MTASHKAVLVTGVAGGLARQIAGELYRRGNRVVGVDYRPVTEPVPYPIHQANYNKTRVEDIFRRHEPRLVLHLGRVGNLKERMGKRFDLNVIGSRKVMDLCLKYGAERLVVLSTFHIYGAHPHNHIPIYEDEPLRAGPAFPQIADAIQLDNQALLWIHQHPEVKTVLLRPCHVVGEHIANAMSTFLRQPVVPTLIGFNPPMQFIHADDLAAAIIRVADDRFAGVYNVAGAGVTTWNDAVRAARARRVPVPAFFARVALTVAGAVSPIVPPYLVNFLKYPCVISDAAIRSTFGWEPAIDALEAVRRAVSTVR